MRILFVIHTPKDERTAVYSVYRRMQACLRRNGYAGILAPQDFPWLAGHFRWIPVLYPFQVAYWLLRRSGEYDLVVFHSFAGWVFNGLRRMIPGLRAMRTVTAFHGLEPLYFRELVKEATLAVRPVSWRFRLFHCYLLNRLIRWTCRRSDRVVCLNRQEEAFLVEHGYQRPKNISVAANGVPQAFFIPRRHPERARILLFVGQWQLGKGTRYLVEAFTELAHEDPTLELKLVGTLKSTEEVRGDFPPELWGKVRVHPSVSPGEILSYYRMADLFLFPTLSEGFSLALLEAMATGLPVIATDVGAARDLLRDGVNGLLISRRDAKALVGSVKALIGDRARREDLGRRAAETAQRFELEKVLKESINTYCELVNGRE